jgi:hypothetical protein
MKLYAEVDKNGIEVCERVYDIDYFKDMIDNGSDELRLELQKIDKGNGFFYCSSNGNVSEVGEAGNGTCGKITCTEYRPRNHKNGRCRFSMNTYVGSGEYFILDKIGLRHIEKKHLVNWGVKNGKQTGTENSSSKNK